MTPDIHPDGGYAEDTHSERPALTDEAHEFPPKTSIKRWLVTTNHKDVGILYIVTSLFFLVFGGVLALLIRLQLWTPGGTILSGLAYNQTVTAHGLLMVFWFISPFAFGFANYVVPLQLGAKDLAFPRLNALSYWLYLASGMLFIGSFFMGGTFDGGWTAYAPLSIPAYTPQPGGTAAMLALTLFTVSVTVSSVNFLTTMHRMRAPGLHLRDLPLFSASILLTVWMMLFAFAALLAALFILLSDRILGTTYLAANEGGALLWAHLFWFFGHPEVYIVFFPALGAMAEAFQTFTGRRLVGRKWFLAAMVLVAVQSFMVWMHHMFLTSINLPIKTLFMVTTIGISLPFDLMVFALIYTLVKGKIQFNTPFLFAFGALVLFILGGITGVFLGAVVLDYEFRGTYWVVAHFHYVMVGGATALFGALYYWFPKMTGRMYDETLGKLHFALYFVGFNLLYFPMFLAWETPRRAFDYELAFLPWHRLATVGAFILGVSFLVMFYNLYRSLTHGEEAAGDPWPYATTAEWTVASPPPLENFDGVPSYEGGAFHLVTEPAAAVADGGATTAGATDAHANPSGDDHASHASIWPLVTSIGAFFAFLGLAGFREGVLAEGMLGTLAVLSLVGGGTVAFLALVAMAAEPFYAPEPERGARWPFARVENTKLGVWIFLASDVVLFGALIGAYVFIRTAFGWTAWEPVPHDSLPGLINTYLLLTSSFAVVLALAASQRRNRWGVVVALASTILLAIGFLINKALEWQALFHEGVTLGSSVQASTFYLTTGLHAAHVIGGIAVAGYLLYRAYHGAYLGDDRPIEYFGLYWHFVDIVWLFLFPLFYIL
ncbi:cbb3-type cytochrome c oxidase subunit I [Natronomonas sp. EA1]|uniref:cbb3-type cytochrome c oxidase subunit I n=1 Tax=Natronomonas sp. EA1 TaxID=3421655 RepID=UPI003EC1084B